MSDIDVQTVTRRLAHLRDVLDDLDGLGPVTVDRLNQDHVLRYAVERMLTLAVDTAVDINTHVATRRVRPPEDARESFALAAKAGVLDAELATRLEDSVGLRNILTHEYLRIDRQIVANAVSEASTGYHEYIRVVARAVADQGT